MKKLILSMAVLASSVIGVAYAQHGRNFDNPEMLNFKDHKTLQKLNEYDLDKDGQLSEKEIANYRNKAGEALKKIENSDHSFMAVDLNHDAFLSFDEFLKLPENETKVSVFGPELIKFLPLVPFFHGPDFHTKEKHHDRKMNEQEKNQHNEIDHIKFKKEMNSIKMFKNFCRYDSDFNGKLDYEEYKAYLVKSNNRMKEKQLWVEKADFHFMDINQDGFVSLKELTHFTHGLTLLKVK